MGGEWKTVSISEVAIGIYDGPHATPQKKDSGPVFLGISSLNKGRLDLSSVSYLSEEDFKRWTRRVTPQAEDIVFSYETRLGEAAIIPKGLRCCLGRRMALIRPDKSKIDPKFLLYQYLGREFQSLIKSRQVQGSTVDRILLTEFPNYPVRLPPLPEQQAIAHILGSLDDKIELNRQINETLEEMARTIFKSWFVDFDPVKAKMEGRDTGLPQEIADLFPDRLVESELGLIPEGWKTQAIGDLIKLKYGKALKASNRNPGHIPVFGSNGIVGFHDKYLVRGPGVIVGRKGNPGTVKWSYQDFYPIDTTFYIEKNERLKSLYYIYYALKEQNLPGLSADSAVPGLSRNLAYMNHMLVPPHNLLDYFEKHIQPLFRKIELNVDQSNTLSTIRDTLLPKLISGELRVPEAEKIAEEYT